MIASTKKLTSDIRLLPWRGRACKQLAGLVVGDSLQNPVALLLVSVVGKSAMPSQGTNPNRMHLGLAAGLGVLALAFWLAHRESGPAVPVTVPPIAPSPEARALEKGPAAMVGPPADSNSRLRAACEAVRTAPNAKAARLQLAELRGTLTAMPTDATVAAIRQMLDSKVDAPTHLGFKVAGNGWLDESPTLRTFLLDELARLDPGAAADYARVVLASMDSPDEWAVAMRNVARGDVSPEGRALLQQKTGEMLRYEAWQHNPSVGYLEAFDVAVHLGGTSLVPALTDLVRKQDNAAVAHAAFLALDRMVINDASVLLGALTASPALMQGREQTRANYFARADAGDTAQREILERYLLDPGREASELQIFAGVYPNANYMISHNLLTSNVTPDGAALARRDSDAMRVVGEWLADPRFAQLQPQLLRIQQRLQEFKRQAGRPP